MQKDIKIKKSKKEIVLEKEQNIEVLTKALFKKALGYSLDEIVEEYQLDTEQDLKLTKRKITKKSVPPDTSALKILLAIYNPEVASKFENLSDQELEEEKQKILKLLEE